MYLHLSDKKKTPDFRSYSGDCKTTLLLGLCGIPIPKAPK